MNTQLSPLANALGVQVNEVDLNKLPDDTDMSQYQTALDNHLVLVFRNQAFTPEQYLRAARRFGEPMAQHLSEYLMENHPTIAVLDSRKLRPGPDGRIVPLGGRDWHTDHTNHARPPKYTMLYAVKLPPTGGDTGFANMQHAYESLDAATRRRIDGMRTVNVIENHDYVSMADKDRFGTAQTHPLLRTHPGNGKKAIYVHPGKLAHIEGLGEKESHAFVKDLLERTLRPEIMYRHQWRVGDLLICDNRAVMHLAYQDYDPAQTRVMQRVIIEGEVPV